MSPATVVPYANRSSPAGSSEMPLVHREKSSGESHCSRSDFSEPHLLLPVRQEAGDSWTDGRRYIEPAGEDFSHNGVERRS